MYAMTCTQLYLYVLHEEQSLRGNAAAWRLTLEQLPEGAARRAVRPMLRALEATCEEAARGRSQLMRLARQEEA